MSKSKIENIGVYFIFHTLPCCNSLRSEKFKLAGSAREFFPLLLESLYSSIIHYTVMNMIVNHFRNVVYANISTKNSYFVHIKIFQKW